ncbi:MAG: exonuclease domain-containing protein [Firmicutes bacterium]|nr:exonuclease domain-containing protein [Bacillota bacterium]
MDKNLIFFDVECANNFSGTGKIYSFGYVITDSQFNILQKDDILINPNTRWDWHVVKNILVYEKDDFLDKPTFASVHHKVRHLLSENIPLGFAVLNDIKHINDECVRYLLEPIIADCYDVQYVHKKLTGAREPSGLIKIARELEIDTSHFSEHKSCDDAHITMLILKYICELEPVKELDVFAVLDMFKCSKINTKQTLSQMNFKRQLKEIRSGYKLKRGTKKVYITKDVENGLEQDALLTLISRIYKRGFDYTKKRQDAHFIVVLEKAPKVQSEPPPKTKKAMRKEITLAELDTMLQK